MAFGFNTGSKQLNNYYEAYYEILGKYYDYICKSAPRSNPFKTSVLPSIKAAVASTRGVYLTGAYDKYYAKLYKSFLSPKGIKKAFKGYNLAGVDVSGVLRKFGFSTSRKARLALEPTEDRASILVTTDRKVPAMAALQSDRLINFADTPKKHGHGTSAKARLVADRQILDDPQGNDQRQLGAPLMLATNSKASGLGALQRQTGDGGRDPHPLHHGLAMDSLI